VAVGDFLSLWEFNIPTNTFYIRNPFTCPFTPFYFNKLRDIFSSFAVLFFAKLKIKGKGYYIYKNYRNTITHQFGHSHRVFIYAYFVTVRFLSKTVVLLFGSSKRDVFTVGNNVQSSKYLNIFTGRGVRFSKQIIYKKTGKVSSYR
jgi:ribosomal protein L6P/L9E